MVKSPTSSLGKKRRNNNIVTNSRGNLRRILALHLLPALISEPKKTLSWVQVLIQLACLAKLARMIEVIQQAGTIMT